MVAGAPAVVKADALSTESGPAINTRACTSTLQRRTRLSLAAAARNIVKPAPASVWSATISQHQGAQPHSKQPSQSLSLAAAGSCNYLPGLSSTYHPTRAET